MEPVRAPFRTRLGFTRTMTPDHIDTVAQHIRTIDAYLREGVSRRDIARRLRAKTWRRVGKGGVVPTSVWDQWFPHQRHLARVIVASRETRSRPVFSHQSAAALLGSPIWQFEDAAPHIISSSAHGRTPTLVRHQFAVDECDVTEIHGFRCTAPERTLVDLSTTHTRPEQLLTFADSILARHARRERRVDREATELWRLAMEKRLRAARGQRGVRLLRSVVSFADARSDSPLESTSRWRFHEFGIAVEPQYAVPSPRGVCYFVDFHLSGRAIFGECDGRSKYLDPNLRGGLSPGEAMLEEKRREDWITATTGNRFIRWGVPEVSTPKRFGEMLHAFRIPLDPPGRRLW